MHLCPAQKLLLALPCPAPSSRPTIYPQHQAHRLLVLGALHCEVSHPAASLCEPEAPINTAVRSPTYAGLSGLDAFAAPPLPGVPAPPLPCELLGLPNCSPDVPLCVPSVACLHLAGALPTTTV